MMNDKVSPEAGDALLVVDVQNDFLPGGNLGVKDGDAVVPVLNRYIAAFAARGLPIFFTRDWHPQEHCSFQTRGGPWPAHCVAGTDGADFAPDLARPEGAIVVSKAATPKSDAYSGFEGTELASELRKRGVKRVYVGGLATDYCVLNTVKDAVGHGFEVYLLGDAIRAVNVQPDDGANAVAEMRRLGAEMIDLDMLRKV
jgi:nicotinamidase/pyrazinamidase